MLARQVSGGRFEVGNSTVSLAAAFDYIAKETKTKTMLDLGINGIQYESFKRLVCKKLQIPRDRC